MLNEFEILNNFLHNGIKIKLMVLRFSKKHLCIMRWSLMYYEVVTYVL
jgi:hypothetical protein